MTKSKSAEEKPKIEGLAAAGYDKNGEPRFVIWKIDKLPRNKT